MTTTQKNVPQGTNVAAVEAALQRRARLFRLKIAAMFVFGVPLSLVGPVVLATMFWVVCLLFGRWYTWSWFFWGGVAVVIPLLYRMEWRGEGNFLVEAVEGDATKTATGLWTLSGLFHDNALAAAAVAANPRAPAAALAEIFLVGPRLVVSAARQLRAAWLMRRADTSRAARVLVILLAHDRGIPTQQVLEGDTLADLAPTLGYLVFHHWIGLSSDAEKLWVLSDERAPLQK